MAYEDLPGGWSHPNVAAVIALIERFGLWGLGGHDGCDCTHFQLHGFEVHVSCRKSEHCIRVHSSVLYTDPNDLIAIARVALSQIDYPKGYSVRFSDYQADHAGSTGKCCYCGEPRSSKADYLCGACKSKSEALETFPLTLPISEQELIAQFAGEQA